MVILSWIYGKNKINPPLWWVFLCPYLTVINLFFIFKQKMNIEEKIKNKKLELETETAARDMFLMSNSNGNGEISLSIESLLEMKGYENRINKLTSELVSLHQEFLEEKRNKTGFQVFGLTEDYNVDSRFIPVNLKDFYDKEFDVMNSKELPSIDKIELFLRKNKQE